MNKKKSRRNVPPNFLGQHLLHHRKTLDEIVRIANVNTSRYRARFRRWKRCINKFTFS